MRNENQNRNRYCGGGIEPCGTALFFAPENRQREKTQPEGQVIVEKAHVERPPVSKHAEARKKRPRSPICGDREESKQSPEKNQNAQDHCKFLCRSESEQIAKL